MLVDSAAERAPESLVAAPTIRTVLSATAIVDASELGLEAASDDVSMTPRAAVSLRDSVLDDALESLIARLAASVVLIVLRMTSWLDSLTDTAAPSVGVAVPAMLLAPSVIVTAAASVRDRVLVSVLVASAAANELDSDVDLLIAVKVVSATDRPLVSDAVIKVTMTA